MNIKRYCNDNIISKIISHEKNSNKSVTNGALIEQNAVQWLEQKGLKLLAQNYRCNAGEIDIIMRDNKDIVFVEVRYRKHNKFGDAAESVNWQKQNKLSKTALHYLAKHPRYSNYPCRFDVMAAKPINRDIQWDWIRNAFIT